MTDVALASVVEKRTLGWPDSYQGVQRRELGGDRRKAALWALNDLEGVG